MKPPRTTSRPYGGKERREAPRLPYQTTLAYVRPNESGVGSVRDISAVGLFVEAQDRFRVGEHLAMRFRFRRSHTDMAIDGEIRRVDPAGVGIRLIWEEGEVDR